jgi:general secretion pathway protein L
LPRFIHIPDKEIPSGTPIFSGQSTTTRDDDIMLIPLSRLAFIDTALPNVSAEKRSQLVNFAIEDKLTIDPSTVHTTVLGASLTGAQHFVVAAISTQWLQGVLAWLVTHQIFPSSAVAASALYPADANEWRIIQQGSDAIAVRADSMSYALHGLTADTPPFELTLALNEAVAAPSGRVLPAVLRITTATDAAVTINTNAWQAHLASLGHSIRVVADDTNLAEANAGTALKSSALRDANLLSKRFLPANKGVSAIFASKTAWILVFFIFAMQFLFIAVDAWKLASERRKLEADMRQLFMTTFPDAKAIVDPALQLSRNLQSLKAARGLLADPARDMLAVAATLVNQQGNIASEINSVNARASEITLGFAADEKREAILRDLALHPPDGFTAVVLSPTADKLVFTLKRQSQRTPL